jgi:hypothetical protein
MPRPIADKKRRKILALSEQGVPQREIAAKVGVALGTVSKVINGPTEGAQPALSASRAEALAAVAAMAPADRLEAQLAGLDRVLATPGITPAILSRTLTTYSTLLDRAQKIRGREGKGERQFDGLADLLLSAAHADSARWSTDPADWLADVVPRQLPELHEVAGALERVSADARKATAERMRPVLHRILAILDAV